MAKIGLKSIKPKKMNKNVITKFITNITLKLEGRQQRKSLMKTVETWKGDKPDFQSDIKESPSFDGLISVTTPKGNKKGVDKWIFLNEGTKVRWAVMSSDWKSKTKPNRIKGGSGRGNPVIVGKRAMQRRNIRPRKGIEPRNWSILITKRRRIPFSTRIIKGIRSAARNLF